MVRVTDEHGAFDEQQVQVQVTGTNDRPFINSPIGYLVVSEDASEPAGRSATAFDADFGAQLTWSVSRDTLAGYSADYLVNMDRFSITRNGTLFFDDSFSDDAPPPSAPNFFNGQPVTYGTTPSTAISEAGGELILEGSTGRGLHGHRLQRPAFGQSTILNTDTNPADPLSGLKINHDFASKGCSTSRAEQRARAMGMQLADSLPGSPAFSGVVGDDQVSLIVRHEPPTARLTCQLLDSTLPPM